MSEPEAARLSDKRLAEILSYFAECVAEYESGHLTLDGRINQACCGFDAARKVIPALLAQVERRRARVDVLEGFLLAVTDTVASTEGLHQAAHALLAARDTSDAKQEQE